MRTGVGCIAHKKDKCDAICLRNPEAVLEIRTRGLVSLIALPISLDNINFFPNMHEHIQMGFKILCQL